MKYRSLKEKALIVLKKHYLILVIACALSAIVGSEFTTTFKVNEITNVINEYQKIPGLHNTIEDLKEKATLANQRVTILTNKIKGNRGVISLIINTLGSNKIYLTLFQTIESITHSPNIATIIMTIFSYIFYFIIWFYIINIFKVIIRRIFLESRTYKKVKMDRFLFISRVRKWNKVSITMFKYSIHLALWYLTIIGGIIKELSYFLVPFIVAENPNIDYSQAVKLSETMMKNHKWELFKLQLSFIGWEILGLLTLNTSKIFFSNPYKLAVMSEYYTILRNDAIKNKIDGYEYLNDIYLYKVASNKLLNDTYLKIANKMQKKQKSLPKIKGLRGILYNYLGITTYHDIDNKMLEEEQLRINSILEYEDIMNKNSYPDELCPIPYKKIFNYKDNLNYMKPYKVTSLVIIFFLLAFAGWAWEVILHLITTGTFINRGVLHGPWLPIYGWGVLLILTILYRFRKKPYILFGMIILVCGIIEYGTSYYLEITNGMRWWDYTDFFLNINGRVCAEGLIAFGIGGLVVVYLIAPIIDKLINNIDSNLLNLICLLFISIFILDNLYSTKYPNTGYGITHYDINQK